MDLLNITIITPESREEKLVATSLIVPLEDGYWGILPRHMNMVATMKSGKITAKTEKGELVYNVSDGWIEVFHDRIIILTTDFKKVQ
ncbi:MAG: F0F1 ATP synthase subunit epsilon [Caldisericales bacterium]|nr:F0F1 ATP synthase subunit epsilon [Caldisericales bacterium]